MKKLINLSLLLVLCAGFNINLLAQDIRFSQFFSNPLSLNPAYAGSLGCSRFVADYRNECPSASYNDVVYCASYDQQVNKLGGGLGLIASSEDDAKGLLYYNTVNGMYSFHINVNDNFHICPAVNIGFGEDHNNFLLGNASYPGYKKTIYYFNAGAGLLFTYKNFDAGLAYDHINRPNVNFLSGDVDKLPAKVTLHGDFQIKLNDNSSLTPGLIFQHEDNTHYFIPSMMLKVWFIKLGIGVRLCSDYYSNDLIGMLGFSNNHISIGYSYDYILSNSTDSSPNKGTGGIHEITLVIKFNCRNKEKYGFTHISGF
jgi:type IX secretion system PorP/SprF family membrane protein